MNSESRTFFFKWWWWCVCVRGEGGGVQGIEMFAMVPKPFNTCFSEFKKFEFS